MRFDHMELTHGMGCLTTGVCQEITAFSGSTTTRQRGGRYADDR
jgi:hypothetical protein